jgi:hypothetical protein
MRTNIACESGMLIVLLLTTGAVASEPPDKLQLVTALLSFCEKRLPDSVRSAEEPRGADDRPRGPAKRSKPQTFRPATPLAKGYPQFAGHRV